MGAHTEVRKLPPFLLSPSYGVAKEGVVCLLLLLLLLLLLHQYCVPTESEEAGAFKFFAPL